MNIGTQPKAGRIPAVDAFRGVALVAMTIYHFSWDLSMFGVVDPRFPHHPGMILFARAIAGSFLFLVGFSLVLAHGNGIAWGKFWRRLAMVAGAAAVITIATYFATPDAFIFFGILHSITVASLLGLAFLRLPWWLNLLLAAFFLTGRYYLISPAFDAPWWWWTGLSERPLVSNDYVPIFPFFGTVLAGMAAAGALRGTRLLASLARPPLDGQAGAGLRFIGRHSLVYYLLHQPVLIGGLAAVLSITGNI